MSFKPAPPSATRIPREDRISPGKVMQRMCATCNKPRGPAGGEVNKRTRQWSCGICVQARDQGDQS